MKNNKMKYIIAGIFVIALIGLPLILSINQKQQESRSRAAPSTTLYFTPSASSSSPLAANIGDSVVFDVMINPGTNLPSLVKLDIQFDPEKLQASPTSFLTNMSAFPSTIEGPLLDNGDLKISLSIGSDTTKAIQSITKVGTLTLTAINPTADTPTAITFGTNTTILSINSSDYATENILSSSEPAYVQITAPATPTPNNGPLSTILSLNTYLHGIGSSGDNTNPTDSRLSNKSPQHLQKTATAFIYDSQNKLISSNSGNLSYDPAKGYFSGSIDIGNSIAQSQYMIKVGVTNHLLRLIPGIQTINPLQTNTLPAVSLITGDVNDDNMLNIVDYNVIINCYSDLLPPKSCNDTNKLAADINDDSFVNQVDYNLFLREIAVQGGD